MASLFRGRDVAFSAFLLVALAGVAPGCATESASDVETSSSNLTVTATKHIFRPGQFSQQETVLANAVASSLRAAVMGPNAPLTRASLNNAVQGAIDSGRLVGLSATRAYFGVQLGAVIKAPHVRASVMAQPGVLAALKSIDADLTGIFPDPNLVDPDALRDLYASMYDRVAEQLELLVNVELSDQVRSAMAYSNASFDDFMALMRSQMLGWWAVAALAALGLGAWWYMSSDSGKAAYNSVMEAADALGGIAGGGCTIRVPPQSDTLPFSTQWTAASSALRSTNVLVQVPVQARSFTGIKYLY